MYNAANNSSQSQQKSDLAATPGQTPATETARLDPNTAQAELGAPDARVSITRTDNKDANPLPHIDPERPTSASNDPVELADSKIVSVDSANMEASDSTIDTDRKGLDAKLDLSADQPNVIGTNATLVNNVATPARGLGGIDSRAEHNLPQIALKEGWHLIHQGSLEIQGRNGGRVEHLISIERIH